MPRSSSLVLLGLLTGVFACAVALGACRGGSEGAATDDLGRSVEVPARARAVVPLAPNVTELVAAAAGVERLAGVAASDDWPSGIAGLERFQSYPLDLERVLGLEPDLAIGSDDVNTADAADGLAGLGVPAYLFRFQRVADVPRALRTLDTLLNASGGAPAAADFERRVERVTDAVGPFGRPRVLLLVGDETLYAFGRDSYASEAVRLAGGDNLTDRYTGAAAQPSDEAVLEMAPEVILVLSADYDPADLVTKHPAFATLPAVQNRRVYGVDPDLVSRAGPRLAEGIEQIARRLHPEAFAAGAA